MRIDDDVTQGTLHVGELIFNPKLVKFSCANNTAFGHMSAWKDPIIEIDDDYIGDFKAQRTLKLEAKKIHRDVGRGLASMLQRGVLRSALLEFR